MKLKTVVHQTMTDHEDRMETQEILADPEVMKVMAASIEDAKGDRWVGETEVLRALQA